MPMALGQLRPPGAYELRMGAQEPEPASDNQGGHDQVNDHHERGKLDHLARKPTPKQGPEDNANDRKQNGDHQLPVPVDADSFAECAWQEVRGLLSAAQVIE